MEHEGAMKAIMELAAICKELREHSQQQADTQQEILCWLSALTLHSPDKNQIQQSFQMMAEWIPEKNRTAVREILQKATQPGEQAQPTQQPTPSALRLVKDEPR